jgi:hypothetical protein
VDRLANILSLPVQAIVQIDGETWCYVDNGRGTERRTVELGRNNDKFVHIVDGIKEGDRAVLNPMAIVSLENRVAKVIAPDAGVDAIQPVQTPIPSTDKNPKKSSPEKGKQNQKRPKRKGQPTYDSRDSDP